MNTQTGPTARLAENLRQKHAELNSWPQASKACKVLTADGRPNPRLAQQIAEEGYEPKETATRERLGLPPICITCGRKVVRIRHIREDVQRGMEILRRLEAAADKPVQEVRVYGRGGRRVPYVR